MANFLEAKLQEGFGKGMIVYRIMQVLGYVFKKSRYKLRYVSLVYYDLERRVNLLWTSESPMAKVKSRLCMRLGSVDMMGFSSWLRM